MKLASYKDGSRDGQLVVVARDLGTAHYATGIASRLQQALDDWNFMAPQLQDLSDALNQGRARHAFAFDPARCMAPLPRAYQWLRATGAGDASAGAEPLLSQGASDDLLGPCDDIVLSDEALDIDFEAGLAVITGDVPLAATPEQGLDAVRLLVLANDLCLRRLIASAEPACAGWLQGRPNTAFSPVAVTPDELGEAWQGGRVHATLQIGCNGRKLGRCETGPAMRFHFGQLMAHAARTRRLRAGSLLGSGALSNPGDSQDGSAERPRGHGCLAEKRALETLRDGAPRTPYLRLGDRVRIELKTRDGQSVLGAIEQEVRAPGERA